MDKPISILLIDDETDFTDPIVFWLKAKGYKVEAIADSTQALEKVKSVAYDIIFLDINMPGMDGLEVLSHIRQVNAELPVIMVTAAFGSEDKITRAKELGISGFFTKNYTFDELAHMIQVTLRTHKKLQD